MKGIFIMSLLSGSGLAVWILNLSFGFSLLVGVHYNESSFWVKSCCLDSVNLSLGFGLPDEIHFHSESSFWIRSCFLGFELIAGLRSTC